MLVTGLVLVAVIAAAGVVRGDDSTHTYEENEETVAWMNKVGPYHNVCTAVISDPISRLIVCADSVRCDVM